MLDFANEELPSNWSTNHRWGDIVINNELQLYRPEQIQHRDDGLYLIGQKQPDGGWLSGLIGSNGTDHILRHDSPWLVEAEIKLPQGPGLLPAFWLRPTVRRKGEPGVLPEIDIMESPDSPKSMKAGIHTRMGADDLTVLENMRKVMCPILDIEKDWNLYGCKYTGTHYEFYFNDELIHKTPVPADHRERDWYVVLNLAIGGMYPGNPTSETSETVEMGIKSLNIGQIDSPNKDVISRIVQLRDEAIQCVSDAAQRQIDQLD